MRKWALLPACALLLLPVAAQAQQVEGHVVGGAGFALDNGFHTFATGGGGFEYRPLNFVGFGGEGAVLLAEGGGADFWSTDVIGRFNMRGSSMAWQPFVAAGHSGILLAREADQPNLWRVRIGVKHWTRAHRGVIAEFVDTIVVERGVPHYLPAFRVGITFR